MTYDGPKTVTFGASPQDEARHRSARLGSRVIATTLGMPAMALTFVACSWGLNLAVSLAQTWAEAVKLGLVAIGVTLTLSGLPIASAVLARSYPAEARLAMRFWLGILAFATVGMCVFVAELEPQNRRLDASWSPRALFSITSPAGDGPARRVMVLALGFIAVAGAGLLGRLAVLAMSESYRLGFGEASALQAVGAPLQHAEASAGVTAISPADVFSLWANSRLLPSPGKAVQGQTAFDDYADTCRLNGVEPMSLTKFGILMTARAEASQGRIIKEKTGGKILYKGWQLASEMQGNRRRSAGGANHPAALTGGSADSLDTGDARLEIQPPIGLSPWV